MPGSLPSGPADLDHALQPAVVARTRLVHRQFADRAYGWTMCTSNSTDAQAFDFTYASSLWSTGLDWMRLPPSTHLLLFGRSSMAQVASALRSGSAALGTLEGTKVLSSADFCLDPKEHPKRHMAKNCSFQCSRWMNCGPLGKPCEDDPHSITVDRLVGGSTITTISNHPQSQRLGSRLNEWLKLVVPKQAHGNFTHGAFMDPHPDFYFDRDCLTQSRNQLEDAADDDADLLPQRRAIYKPEQYCDPWARDACTKRHPHFDVVSRWVDSDVASVISPPRKASNAIPFLRETHENDETYNLRCVTDEQLEDCDGRRNLTVWLSQAQEAYEYGNAADEQPANCLCKHICNARCVQRPGTKQTPHCYVGPGVAAAWLVLRAAGLAT